MRNDLLKKICGIFTLNSNFSGILSGLSGESLNAVVHRVNSLEMLMCKNDKELRAILTENSHVREEEVLRLLRAINCLRMSQNCIKTGSMKQTDLFWDSWDRHHHSQLKPGTSPRTDRGKLNNRGIRNQNIYTINTETPINNQHELQIDSPLELSPPGELHTLTPSPSPPNSPANSSKMRIKGFPTTPPPKKKHQTLILAPSLMGTPPPYPNNTSASNTSISGVNSGHMNSYDQQSLSKSRSHEFQLLKQKEQNNHSLQQPQSQNQDNFHPILQSCSSHQSSLNNQSSNVNPANLDSGANILQSTATINTSECNTNISYTVPTPRSRLHTEPGKLNNVIIKHLVLN